MKIKMTKGKVASGDVLKKGKIYDTEKEEVSDKDARYLITTGAAYEPEEGEKEEPEPKAKPAK